MSTAENSARALARPAVRAIPLYQPDAGACAVDLSDNTNLWGAAPAALRAIASPSSVSRYPSLYSAELGAAVLHYLGLENANDVGVACGCGSDDVIDSALRAFAEPGDTLAYAAPTFSMVPVFAQLNGLHTLPIRFTDDFELDAEALVATAAKVIYLCTPNNPTATPLSRQTVEYVVRNAPGLVLLDEAYGEFASESFADLAATGDRVIVLRTFSKAFGLAGLRVGYGVGSRDLVRLVERARGPYKVNALAERAALASLGNDSDALPWVRARAAEAIANRDRLAGGLSALGLAPLPSAANFLFVPTRRAAELARALVGKGVLVRAFTSLPREPQVLADAGGAGLRIGVGPWDMMQSLLDALRAIL